MQSLIVLPSLVSELAGRVKISGRPFLEIRVSQEKNYIFGIFVGRVINYVNFV